jgi:hypothetical protein
LQEQNEESADFRLVVTGKLGTREVVEQQVLSSFRSNTALLLTVFLARSCAANLCREAGSGQTCDSRSGQCVPVPIRAALPEAEGDGLDEYTRPDFASASQDGAVPGGADAGAFGLDGAILGMASDAGGPSPDALVSGSNPGGSGVDAGPAGVGGTASADAASVSPQDAGAGSPRDAGSGSASDGGGVATDAGGTAPVDAGPAGPTPTLPSVSGTCPTLATGTATILGASLRLWVGPKRGPLIVYWHATGTTSTEVNQMLPGATNAVTNEGGMVVSFEMGNGQGTNTSGTFIWTAGDLQVVDQLVACGVAQGKVDPTHIHTAGLSAGGMQASAMVFLRSSYVASAFVYSAGLYEDMDAGMIRLEDASNVPSVGFGHGAKGSDVLIVDNADMARATEARLKALGGFSFDCDDGGNLNVTRGTTLGSSVLQFFKDHPYKRKPSPYASALPSSWPTYCVITR